MITKVTLLCELLKVRGHCIKVQITLLRVKRSFWGKKTNLICQFLPGFWARTVLHLRQGSFSASKYDKTQTFSRLGIWNPIGVLVEYNPPPKYGGHWGSRGSLSLNQYTCEVRMFSFLLYIESFDRKVITVMTTHNVNTT